MRCLLNAVLHELALVAALRTFLSSKCFNCKYPSSDSSSNFLLKYLPQSRQSLTNFLFKMLKWVGLEDRFHMLFVLDMVSHNECYWNCIVVSRSTLNFSVFIYFLFVICLHSFVCWLNIHSCLVQTFTSQLILCNNIDSFCELHHCNNMPRVVSEAEEKKRQDDPSLHQYRARRDGLAASIYDIACHANLTGLFNFKIFIYFVCLISNYSFISFV